MGSIQREEAPWLRFYDLDGNLILLPAELAEIERQNAEIERQNAEIERQNAESERQRTRAAYQQAEIEHQRAERLAAQLRQLGINPDETP
jgi:septal ring factor EnvC (AmiA/AmiB activator)